MKRAISNDFRQAAQAVLIGLGLLAAAACTAPESQPAEATDGASGWVATPMILGAERTGQGLTLRGTTAPSGRVVVRGAAGVAYATGADAQGRFSLRIGAPATDTLFVVETQTGQDAAPAPYRLLVTRDALGPIALLTPGGASRRLDAAGPLDVIDGDSRAFLASGRATPRTVVPVALGASQPVGIPTGPDGRWIAPMEGGATRITVGDRDYLHPAWSVPTVEQPLTVSHAPGGTLVHWMTPGGPVQQAWFPAAASH
jgi:hypothetical protein